MTDLILAQINPPLCTITLNRPQRHNSLIPEMLVQLQDVLTAVDADPNIRAVLLQANGRSFSTGGDVQAFYQQGANLEVYASEIVGLLNQVILHMLALRVSIVTAVHGIVTGGSLGLLLASDIVLLAPAVTIQPWYSVVGFSPDGGWSAILPRLIGRARTADLLLTNGTINAQTAVAWGLASRIVPAAQIHPTAHAIAHNLSHMQPGSLSHTRQLLAQDPHLPARLEAERRHFIQQILTPEAQTGMATFLRKPGT